MVEERACSNKVFQSILTSRQAKPELEKGSSSQMD
jgi:hypothetical protein